MRREAGRLAAKDVDSPKGAAAGQVTADNVVTGAGGRVVVGALHWDVVSELETQESGDGGSAGQVGMGTVALGSVHEAAASGEELIRLEPRGAVVHEARAEVATAEPSGGEEEVGASKEAAQGRAQADETC